MLEKLNANFWFWVIIAFINISILSLVIKADNKFTCTFVSCMLFLSLAKSLRCTFDMEKNER